MTSFHPTYLDELLNGKENTNCKQFNWFCCLYTRKKYSRDKCTVAQFFQTPPLPALSFCFLWSRKHIQEVCCLTGIIRTKLNRRIRPDGAVEHLNTNILLDRGFDQWTGNSLIWNDVFLIQTCILNLLLKFEKLNMLLHGV